MKVSLNWLKEYVELPPSVSELTELLTLAGVEVEGVESRGVAIDKVVVAQILESTQHPNADRLSVCKVDDGSGSPRQIVCGAKNYQVGDKVPLALPGAVLPGDFKIKVGKLRGVESQGMLCSAKELNLAEDAAGLLILPPAARIGTPLAELFPADTILDLEITPNRADLLSYAGMAREIGALTGKPVKRSDASTVLEQPEPAPSAATSGAGAAAAAMRIDLAAPEKCPFYSARRIAGVTVGPSPAWLVERLRSSGIRAINNVVDITNLVMLETGQPLHAFDADKLAGGIRVRAAADGEEFLALDGRTRRLGPDDLLIADEARGIAIAGVMGGAETGVTGATANILLESACFQPSGIRRTSRRLGLVSDSSYRFERGVDPAGVLRASARAARLIAELAGGTPGALCLGVDPASAAQTTGLSGEKEWRSASSATVHFTHEVWLRPERVGEVLGIEVPPAQIDGILTGFGLQKGEGKTWRIPSFRRDLAREIDLIEEVTRVFGIEKIPGRTQARIAPSSPTDRAHDRNMRLRATLAAQGFYEARTLALISGAAAVRHVFRVAPPSLAAEVEAEAPAGALSVRNPLGEDRAVLRPSLLPGLLAALERSVRGGSADVRIFEIGRVFQAGHAATREESVHLGLVLTGAVCPRSWREAKPRPADFFDLKGVLASLGLGEMDFVSVENAECALCATICVSGIHVGQAGQLPPADARALGLATPIFVAEIDLSSFAPDASRRHFRELPRYPAVTRDIALLAPHRVAHSQIEAVLRSAHEPLLASVELFDLFTDPAGVKVAAGQKSMAYSLTYRSPERTLTTDEINAAHARLKERLKADLDITFRE